MLTNFNAKDLQQPRRFPSEALLATPAVLIPLPPPPSPCPSEIFRSSILEILHCPRGYKQAGNDGGSFLVAGPTRKGELFLGVWHKTINTLVPLPELLDRPLRQR